MNAFAPVIGEIPAGHFIGGHIVRESGASMPVLRPSDRQAYAELPAGGADIVDQAVQSAQAAFRRSQWSTQHPRMRARAMRKWADLVEAAAEDLARIESIGSTRPFRQALTGDVPYVAEAIRFFAELADKIGGEVAATQSARLGFMITEPYGVTAAIVPWNFPLIMAVWKIAPALAAGNAVVLKPSELTPFSVVRLAELALKAGIPEGIFNVVQGTGPTTGDALVRHPGVSKITFTGSTAAGAAIMTASAESGIKPVTLELGGKSPQLVFSDADLDLAARCIVNAITFNAGQVCVAGSRLLVHRKVADKFVVKIRHAFESQKPAATWAEDVGLSPIVSQRQLERIDRVIKSTVEQGATVLTGGSAFDAEQGSFYRPTLLADLRDDMDAVREEVFGPVLTVQEFDTDEEAVSLANHPTYGLAAGVYSRDISRVLRVTRRLEAGTIWVNRYGRSEDLAIPTGGYKQSGIGKDLGRHAFEANQRLKSVLIDIDPPSPAGASPT